jgi:outer membrane protein OmpA-like peptidoglycan-associated protein
LSSAYRASAGLNYKFGLDVKPDDVSEKNIKDTPVIVKHPETNKIPNQITAADLEQQLVIKIEIGEIKDVRLQLACFEANSAELSAAAKQNIKAIAKAAQKNGYTRIVLEGHSDSVEERQNSLQLSKDRVDAAFREFVLNGISPFTIESAGFGYKSPVSDNNTEEGKKRNRVVNIFIE